MSILVRIALLWNEKFVIKVSRQFRGRETEGFFPSVLPLGTFKSEYEYEIEYDFSNLVRRVYINTSNTNLVPRPLFSTGQQPGGARALAT